MRKQTKVLAAAALFTLGASFSAFAAKTGRWVLEDEGWMCYGKDGDPYENEWCLSAGKEFYVGDDGVMVTSDWVEYDNNHYYVGSDGAKTINDWRYVTPVSDEDEDEEWFYFDNKGKRVNSKKKVINGKTYYFDNDGVMLTGWVNTVGYVPEESADVSSAVYCGEDGARLSKEWIEVYGPEVDLEEDDLDNESMHWYWVNKDGSVAKGKKANINGQTYYFSATGHMLTGWVAETTNSDGDVEYIEIGTQYQTKAISDSDFDAVFFCGDSDDGHAKKNTWVKTWNNIDYYDKDSDDDQHWFWIAKDGEVFVPTASDATRATKVKFEEGALVDYTGTDMSFDTKTIGKKVYAFNMQGEMISGFVRNDRGEVLYFGGSDDGIQKTGTLTITDNCDEAHKFCFGTKNEDGYRKYVGVTGNKGGKLYEDGLLVTPTTYKYADVTVTIAKTSYNFIVNSSGTIQTAKKEYEDGDFYKDLRSNSSQTVTFAPSGSDLRIKNSYTVRK